MAWRDELHASIVKSSKPCNHFGACQHAERPDHAVQCPDNFTRPTSQALLKLRKFERRLASAATPIMISATDRDLWQLVSDGKRLRGT
jgi:hypothetical protein